MPKDKKKKEKDFLDSVTDSYLQLAVSGMLGNKAKAAAKKKRKK